MRKAEFLNSLRKNLADLSASEVEEILADQDEYIRDAVSHGRLEDDVIAGLGDPKQFAASLTAMSKVASAQQSRSLTEIARKTMGAVFAILALAPLNLIFVLGPLVALVAILFAGWVSCGAVVLASFFAFVACSFKSLFFFYGFWNLLFAVSFSLGFAALGLAGLVLMVIVTKWFLQALLAYLRWNISFVAVKV